MKKEFPYTKANELPIQPRTASLSCLIRVAACLVAVFVLIHAPAPYSDSAAAASVDGHYTTAFLSAQEHTAGNLLNSDRLRYGLGELILDPQLCRIARMKSEDMRDNQYFAHTSPTYGDVRDMLDHFGYSYSAASENIANHATVEKCQTALISSPGHRRNILSKTYTKFGIGVALDKNGYVYMTQIFCR